MVGRPEGSPDEHRPLLGAETSQPNEDGLTDPAATEKPTRPLYIITLLLAQIVALQLSNCFIEPAVSELEEAAICREHYNPLPIPDPANDARCKSEPVQSELSMLQGVELMIALLPGLLTSVLYGLAAEKYGRRPILIICTFGLMLMYPLDLLVLRFLPVKFIWLVANANYIGGGVHVMMALVYTIVCDVTSETQRSTAFFYVSAATAGTPLVGSPLTYLAMKKGPWFSGCLSSLSLLVMFLFSFAVPETGRAKGLKSKKMAPNRGPQESPLLANPTSTRSDTVSLPRNGIAALKSSLSRHRALLPLLVATLFATLGSRANTLLMQFIAKRLSYSWAEASLTLSIKAVTKLVLVLLILPLVSLKLSQAKVSASRNNALMARYCIILAALGRSNIAIIFSMVSVLENLAVMLAGPGVAFLFQVGLRWGSQWYGLPFMVAGALMGIAAIIVLSVSLGNDHTNIRDDGGLSPGNDTDEGDETR
ncbi:hypothetical protein QQS21_009115 [Conoideocrella luteorostrata]|uniref:Major facilitator superfamily transporter n=1 Tax=Conoideocrella luteorostrata TaxID=1105319 RepID=A0AAJ0FQK1_9HYPO|nr:hypothetical protein QQS21_009115 [Conoideocrella luteorostrata]